ncbi:terpenoid synthase [Marasmius fiardii PR-910]|nr:terpenoid synthase [Marasmius fiardii PR-910]
MAMESKAIDTSLVPQYFQKFPVRVHKDEPLIAQCSSAVLETFERLVPETKLQLYAAGPDGVYAMCYPEAKTEKLKLSAEIFEALVIYDDVFEVIPHGEAALEHVTVVQMLARDKDGTAQGKKNVMASIFRGLADRITALDSKRSPWIIGTLKRYFIEHDGNDKPYEDLEEYTIFRTLNVGFRLVKCFPEPATVMETFMQWNLDVYLSEEETKLTKDFYAASGRVMGLTNDYYSWEMEKRRSVNRSAGIRNAIPVIMKQYSLSEKDAKIFLKGYIVEAEEVVWGLGLDLKKAGSDSMKKYVDAMFLFLGGTGFWSATCPRYKEVRK